MFDIVGLGTGCIDNLLRIPDFEKPLEEKPILEWSVQGGGPVASAMAAAGRLGAKVTVIGTVGDDEWGRLIVSNFKKYNVDTSHIIFDRNIITPIAFCLAGKNGDKWLGVPTDVIKSLNPPEDIRRAVIFREAHPRPTTEAERLRAEAAHSSEELNVVTEGKILNLNGSPRTLEAARIANRKGIPAVYDMYNHPNLIELLKNITYCIPSVKAAADFTKETDPAAMCKKLITYGPEAAGVTLGEEGSVFATKDEVIKRKAFKIQAVDTTGAGDVFHGAFSFGIVQGWDLARVIEFSSAVSAIKCTKLGGRAGLPTLPEVEAFLKKRVEEIR